MLPTIAMAARQCEISAAERALLLGKERPIVLLRRRQESTIARQVAPGQLTLGVMLPYTPLHELLLEPEPGFPIALIMTSGNRSEEPIAYTQEGARHQLRDIADAYLLHNRPIETRCDDSVTRVFRKSTYSLRRSRGFAPYPVQLAAPMPPVLAVGGELKNTFCLTRDHYAFVSHHIGNLQNYETLRAFEGAVAHYQSLFRTRPEVLAYDLHPDYLASRYALERAQNEGLPAVGVQHHHAHIAACMAESDYHGEEPVIGLAFDGTGYGPDGAIWGGEVLVANYTTYRRAFHLRYVPLPGGEAAVRAPWRTALAWLRQAGIEWSSDLPPVEFTSEQARSIVDRQLRLGLNTPATSSMGRLFDAVSSLMGIRQVVSYEAQAAMEMESQLSLAEKGAYTFALAGEEIDPRPVMAAIVDDMREGLGAPIISARFHNGLAQLVLEVCREIRARDALSTVALSGGVWQNMALLHGVLPLLEGDGFTVLIHQSVPTNDGGLSLGQAVVAGQTMAAVESGSDLVPAGRPLQVRE
jgi:hydrogenase maturation protein HypF